MKKIIFILLVVASQLITSAECQNHTVSAKKPKIIVGLMVDQMRWDYLYKYQNRYGNGGFKRLLNEGFSCENTMISHAPTVTACGHSSVYTGSVPAINGIAGNSWYDRSWGREISNVEDTTVTGVDGNPKENKSPRNLLTTTIGDELRIATNYQSKVVGVSIKDRGAILPAGHTANAAFWEGSGGFTTSTYYMDALPGWAKKFNEKNWNQILMPDGWKTLYPLNTYVLSDKDDKDYETSFSGENKPVFPHKASISNTPFGNTWTLEFAKAAIEGYQLGQDQFTDLLAVSLSSPDKIGHGFGPNSIEVEDNYLRLDKDLENFFSYLDKRFGKNGYLFFITADHGVNHSPGYLEEHRIPTGVLTNDIFKNLNQSLKAKFGASDIILATSGYQIYLDYGVLSKIGIDKTTAANFIIDQLKQVPGIETAFLNEALASSTYPEPVKSMLINGFNPKRSGDIVMVKSAGWKNGSRKGATHGDWNPYDAHIPLVWMGTGIRPGKTHRTIGMTDIAPTLAALLNIQQPSGCIGHVITEITD
jgi:predicted AlkP superfamily pyrophosphatase or phosphodiesterase